MRGTAAVRASFALGTPRTRIRAPHFTVKNHRSRSNFTEAHNDRYKAGDFDVLLCNVSNSIFRSKALDRGLPLIEDGRAIAWLKEHYGVDTDAELRRKTYGDWRACLPRDIARDGILPRTPAVMMDDDPDWFGLDELAGNLRKLINGSG